jgi:RNA methyltransferase, TrmH family
VFKNQVISGKSILLKRTENKRKFPTKKISTRKPTAQKSSDKRPATRRPAGEKYSPKISSAPSASARSLSSDRYSPRKLSDENSSVEELEPTKSPVHKTFSKPLKEQEFTVYGFNACMAVFKSRPDDIRRVFFSQERSSSMAAVKRWCQTKKLPYRELDAQSLYKVASSAHHEGAVMVVRPVTLKSIHGLLRQSADKAAMMVALDRVGDTHNLGAILRSCAFFGASGLILGNHEDQAKITSSAARMAEGAVETVSMYQSSDLASALRDFRERKVFVVGADAEGGHSLYETEISFPCVVVVGNENQGLSEKVKKRCHALVRVPGCGDMQSLNVSVATGVILAELNRRKNLLSK